MSGPPLKQEPERSQTGSPCGGSGAGADSALEAMIKKRAPLPHEHATSKHTQPVPPKDII